MSSPRARRLGALVDEPLAAHVLAAEDSDAAALVVAGAARCTSSPHPVTTAADSAAGASTDRIVRSPIARVSHVPRRTRCRLKYVDRHRRVVAGERGHDVERGRTRSLV
jgi:hypothetical protein